MSAAPPIDPALEENLIVRSLSLRMPAGSSLGSHDHPWPQLVYAPRGVMSVTIENSAWVVPPQRAVWVSLGHAHAIEATSAVALRTLYFRPSFDASPPLSAGVFAVTPLLRELILETTRAGYLDRRVPEQLRLAEVMRDRLRRSAEIAVELALPQDPRALTIAVKVRTEPASRSSLAELARGVGASARTLERLFVRETGMSFGRWRQQARLLHAMGRLAQGAAVTEVATASGYDSTSAFIAMFKRSLGTTPGRFVEEATPISDNWT